jgi:4-amino-4-deoxy-L-arabinose transferase-like glycosyltransferase
MDGLPQRYVWLAILALALGVRLAAGAWWQNRLPPHLQFAFPDSEGYWRLAQAIAEGKPYRYGAGDGQIFRTPGYPLLLAPLFLVFGPNPPVSAARILSALLGTAAVAGVMGIARLLFDNRVALLAGLATALDPGTISLGVFVLSEAPFCPLMVANLGGWMLAWRSPDRRRMFAHAAWAGVAAGLATLMRPSWLLFLPFASVVGLAVISDRRKHIAISAAMLAALCVTMSPWWMRSYSITGRFIPTTLQVGPSLYDGLSPQADGSSNMDFVPKFVAEQERIDAESPQPLKGTLEERLDQRMRDASIRWAKDHPGRVLQLVGIKFLRMWSPWPNAADLGSFAAKLAIAVGYVPLIVLGLWGAGRYCRRDWSYVLLVLPAVYFTLLHVIFVSSLRYRQPAMLLMAILAAAVACDLWDRYKTRARSEKLSTV